MSRRGGGVGVGGRGVVGARLEEVAVRRCRTPPTTTTNMIRRRGPEEGGYYLQKLQVEEDSQSNNGGECASVKGYKYSAYTYITLYYRSDLALQRDDLLCSDRKVTYSTA